MAKRRATKPVRRDAKTGRILPGGGSLNPGGVPRVALELRQQALRYAPAALRKARQLVKSDDPYAVDVGLRHILSRALGRESPPADLPDDTRPEPLRPDPASLLSASLEILAHNLGTTRAKLREGQALTAEEQASLTASASALATLVEQERKLAKEGGAAGLTDEQLKAAVLAELTPDELLAELSRRAKAPTEKRL